VGRFDSAPVFCLLTNHFLKGITMPTLTPYITIQADDLDELYEIVEVINKAEEDGELDFSFSVRICQEEV